MFTAPRSVAAGGRPRRRGGRGNSAASALAGTGRARRQVGIRRWSETLRSGPAIGDQRPDIVL